LIPRAAARYGGGAGAGERRRDRAGQVGNLGVDVSEADDPFESVGLNDPAGIIQKPVGEQDRFPQLRGEFCLVLHLLRHGV